MHRFIFNSLRLQFDKTALVESLSEQKRLTDVLNRELMAEIMVRKREQEMLRDQTERFHMLSENAPFGMVMIGMDGTFEYINPKFKEIFGYDLSEVPNGRVWLRKAYPDSAYRHGVVSAWFKALEGHGPGEARTAVFEVTCKDGSRKIIDFRPVKLSKGEDLMTCEDITDRKKAEEALRESEDRYRQITEYSLTGIFIHQDSVGVFVNQRLADMLGHVKEEMIGRSFFDAVHPDDHEAVGARVQARLRGEESSVPHQLRLVKKAGEVIWCDILATLIDYRGRPAIMGNLVDITERKKVEQELRESEDRFRVLFEEAPEGILVADIETRKLRFANPAVCEMFGYTMEEMVQLNVSDIHPAELIPQVAAMFETIGTIEKPMAQNFPCLRNDGSVFYADIVGSPVVIDQRKLNVGFFTDTTERKLAEDALKASLREKEILLREIHHRVKNNLQLISSLLRLQSRQIEQKDEILVEMFEDIQGRIKAIALVHEALYRSENLELIDMSQYLQGIVAGLRTVSTQSMQELRINTDVKNISMGINAALACGLIVNELVTNSLKHAFPKGREGKIVVTLSPIGEEEFQLTVHDNGIGMPKCIDLRQPESLGLDLVVSLAEQLHGSVEFTGGEGTEVRVRFREQTNSSDSH